ncbi:MAG TPA: flagellar hook-basal body complex protein FliE [Chromatiaceae bacterium]|jgi:flagellar hook-basal body complex protein FliE|nr:flagellar hook-basal body complex protein FliE [Chromatiaceae bacterium]HIA09095.1 flagellar hook-basal body complex protein FliE [Chromatiaceae bacterium]HIB85116.1 flagellar hook-basal body complex protein FliE [Chromatiaceae bacterium]HIN82687.1 flagellar hook-basal body complex protein FliE [Chromatiales bacterium]HIO53747.1 flagellar hook-basal body complex protein FliE [Chromatiales bacterium]
MNRVDVDQVLGQMRAMAAQAQNKPAQSNDTQGPGFGDLLKNSINKVNDVQSQAGAMAKAFETGQGEVDLSQVMVQLQKANVSFQAMVQVRNKLVDAYKDIMSMPL